MIFNSIIGIEVNNPEVCIKGNGHFVCICKECTKEMMERMDKWSKELDNENKNDN